MIESFLIAATVKLYQEEKTWLAKYNLPVQERYKFSLFQDLAKIENNKDEWLCHHSIYIDCVRVLIETKVINGN
jgi:hypothetical protein